ncbi:MAG: DMT family transporter [Gordonia sp. (in: high G+C Gram-positive bacteria)]
MIAAASWGSAATFIKFALDSWGPMTLLIVQLASANIVLWTIVVIRGYRRPPQVWKVFLLGALEPGLCYALLTIGLLFTTAANAAVLSAMESFFAVVLAVAFLHERLTRRAVAGLTLALAGVLILEAAGGLSGIHLGDALVLGGILAAGFYVVLARTIADSYDALTMTAHQFAAGLALALPFAIIRWASGAEVLFQSRPISSWVAALGVGIIGYALSFLLYNFAIAHVRAGFSSIILNLMPVFGVLTALIFLHERVGPLKLLGAALVLASICVFPSHDEADAISTAQEAA